MNLARTLRAFAALAFLSIGFALPSHAAVTRVYFSVGPTCGGANSATFTPGGANITASLCVDTTAPTATCGHTIVLQAANGESDRFRVVGRTLAAAYPDPNLPPTNLSPYPVPISDALSTTIVDFGGTANATTPVPGGSAQVLATFDIAPQLSATNGAYVISLAPVSSLYVEPTSTCGTTLVPGAGQPLIDEPLVATFTMNRVTAPAFTSATGTTFTTSGFNTFTVAAAGNQPIAITTNSTLPNGVTFNGSVLSGTPTQTGSFPIVFSAMNSNGTTPQNFTLSVVSGQAPQTITFVGPATQNFSSALVPLTASASSGLPITFSSSTPFVCGVSGANVSMITTGNCTILASQAGNSSFQAASFPQSFLIVATLPGAPTIGTATPGNGQAVVAFTGPASTGGYPVTLYTATCAATPGGTFTATGVSSPITVTGLTNGTPYTCSVAATNTNGMGPQSGTVLVTPAAGAVSLVSVVSRKTHGTFVGNLPLTIGKPLTSPDVEPRLSGTGHQIVFTFNNPVTSVTSVDTIDSAAATNIGGPTQTISGNEVTVTLTGAVLDNKRLTVRLFGVNGSLDTSINVGFLVGDVNNSRTVTGADILQVKGRSGLTADSTNYQYDLNASGAITGADILQVKGRSGLALNP